MDSKHSLLDGENRTDSATNH